MPYEGGNILHKNSLNTFPHSFKCLECVLQVSIPTFNLQIAALTYFRSIKQLSILQILELDSSSLFVYIFRSTAWNFSSNKFNISLLLSVPFIVVIELLEIPVGKCICILFLRRKDNQDS